jgi:large subunit ribosomal protein L13
MGLTKSFYREDAARKWYLVDLKGEVLGRAASKIAKILKGKNKATYTFHQDVGDFIVAINAGGLKLTGSKSTDKMYYHYTNHIGGIKEESAESLLKRKPEMLLYRAVKGMLPRTILGRNQLKKLKIYPGSAHPHEAQKPELLQLKDTK